MSRIEKTVFISYRRTNAPWALAIFKELTHHGYDVFFDYTGIASGDFESVILENIRSRAHFLVLLTPSALERCGETGDWLRREIETALEARRNIVPLRFEGFDFSAPSIASQLTGKLAELKRYQAVLVTLEYFDAAMARLREKSMNVSLDAVPHPASAAARQAAEAQQVAAEAAPIVSQEQLTAQEWFEKGFNATDTDEKIRCYSEAIRLEPNFAAAYNNRGLARHTKEDLDGFLDDFAKLISLKPYDAYAYFGRGLASQKKGDLDGALRDYTMVIHLNPGLTDAYCNRGLVHGRKGDLDRALQDFSEAIRLRPDLAIAYYGRAIARGKKGDWANIADSFADYQRFINLGGVWYNATIKI